MRPVVSKNIFQKEITIKPAQTLVKIAPSAYEDSKTSSGNGMMKKKAPYYPSN